MKLCKCGRIARAGQGYCAICHAAYMRSFRSTHEKTAEQRWKDNARSYLRVYIKRGKVLREPCSVCGIEPAEPHHPDYSKPLQVIWLCKPHHLELHGQEREMCHVEQFVVPTPSKQFPPFRDQSNTQARPETAQAAEAVAVEDWDAYLAGAD